VGKNKGNSERVNLLLIGALAIVFIWSAVRPRDYFTWLLEVAPAIIGFVVLAATYRKFRFTQLVYILCALHAIVLMVGGHYTYAEVPLFNWIRDTFGLTRNHYDRVGHFAQGFVPAMVTREILLRTSPLRAGQWLTTIVVAVCLAISALYELLEWAVAAATGSAAEAFLGTQGDAWDTQKDMAICLVGALAALLTMTRIHDLALASLHPDRY
jgi:putative membrane protein